MTSGLRPVRPCGRPSRCEPVWLTLCRQHCHNAIGVPTSRLSRLVNYVRRMLEFPRDKCLARKMARFAALHRRFDETSVAQADALVRLSESEQHFLSRWGRAFLVTLYSGSYRSCAKRGPVATSVLRTVPQAWSETLFTASRSAGERSGAWLKLLLKYRPDRVPQLATDRSPGFKIVVHARIATVSGACATTALRRGP